MLQLVRHAMELAERKQSVTDERVISMLGEGKVAEETLAIAVYCSLKCSDSFEKAIIASVNHGGDSDSTGAVTGNLLVHGWALRLSLTSLDIMWKLRVL